MLVRSRQEPVVSIHKLNILTAGYLNALVPGGAESAVVFSDVDDVAAIGHQLIHRT